MASLVAAPSAEASHSSNNAEYNLILLKGRGTKRKFNKKHARRVNPKVNKGGWTSVQVEGQEQSIPWRNKAWKVRDPKNVTSISLEKLPDECLVQIFSFLGAGEHIIAPMSNEELERDFSDEELEQMKNRSVDYVDTKISLHQAMVLHKTIALLSKRFNRLCCRSLASILGHTDADLILNQWQRFTPWLTKNKLRLKSLKIRSEVFEDSIILLYILPRKVRRLSANDTCCLLQVLRTKPQLSHVDNG